MSTILHKQSTTNAAQRKWQMLALIILAFLTIIAIAYVLLYTVGHINLLHSLLSAELTPGVMYGHP
jgi:hypothetical protein